MDTSVRRIVKNFLQKNKYDGLVNPGNCSCMLENLMPCDEPNGYCIAGYLIKLEECKHCPRETICISVNRHVRTCPYYDKGGI